MLDTPPVQPDQMFFLDSPWKEWNSVYWELRGNKSRCYIHKLGHKVRTAAGSHSSAQVCRCTHLCHRSFGLKERRDLWSLTLSSSGHGTRLVHGTERPVSACSASGAANWWSASRHADRLTQMRSSQLASLLKPLLEMMAQITPDIPSHLRTQLPFSVIQARVSL